MLGITMVILYVLALALMITGMLNLSIGMIALGALLILVGDKVYEWLRS
jgi:hypothetical protein